MSSSKDYLGSYRLIRLIRGGQACNVWDAIRDEDQERVALKVLIAGHKDKKAKVDEMRNEARVGEKLDHPNVVRVFEINERYELPFLVMQLFIARNLKQELRENPDRVAENMRQIILQGMEALQYFHDQGWVHCDVKPDNFLVNEEGEVKLIDYSIAQSMKKRVSWFSRNKVVQGTRSYMAPEQIRNKSLDARTDIYGFGCTCFELASGKLPFSGVSPDDLLQKHLSAEAPSVTAFNRAITDNYANLISRMLHKNPDRRPQSFADLMTEMKSIRIFRPGQKPVIGRAAVDSM